LKLKDDRRRGEDDGGKRQEINNMAVHAVTLVPRTDHPRADGWTCNFPAHLRRIGASSISTYKV
jgi:hypothetical protein